MTVDGSRRRAGGRALRHHARRRHAAAARRRAPADRQDGASAQPAALRRRARGGSSRATRVLQPRVTPSLPVGREGSLYQRVFSGPGGIDPYAAAVSDVYQDLFGEGSYTGKGIYDVDAFEAALDGPRAGEHAAQPRSVRRHLRARRPRLRHRGRRGVSRRATTSPPRASIAGRAATGSCCRGCSGGRQRPACRSVGRWKMLDNLRRSLLGAGRRSLRSCVGWLLPLRGRRSSGPASSSSTIAVAGAAAGASPRSCRGAPASRCAATCARSPPICALALRADRAADRRSSPHQAWLMGDAIVRTLYRLFVSAPAPARMGRRRRRRRSSPRLDLAGLLPPAWRAASLLGRRGRRARWRWPRSVLAGRRCRSRSLWIAAPAIALLGRAARRRSRRAAAGLAADARALRLIARRTWRFFETFVTPADNMLPPTTSRRIRSPVVAHRTSPTNIGLYLLSTVAARDFGWTGTIETVERLEATLATMARLAALPRPFLQLVRHARPAAARAALRLVGRQRQSRRPPDRARQRLRANGATTAAGRAESGAGHRRQPRSRARGAATALPRRPPQREVAGAPR